MQRNFAKNFLSSAFWHLDGLQFISVVFFLGFYFNQTKSTIFLSLVYSLLPKDLLVRSFI